MATQCPDCGSEDIHPSHDVVGSVFSTPTYVCDECGYSGVFIVDSAPSSDGEEIDSIEESPKESSQDPYAGFFTRAFCLFADIIFLSIILWLVEILITPLLIVSSAAGLELEKNLFITSINLLLSLTIFAAYFTWYTGTKKATPGKKIMRVEVVDEHDKPVGIKRAAVRELGKILLLLSSTPLLNPLTMGDKNVTIIALAFFAAVTVSHLTMISSKTKQSFWDKAAGSYVKKKQPT